MAPTQSGAAALAPSPSLARDAATPRKQRVPPRIVAAAVAGNAMEFYDFTTYAFFAVYIGKTFFPATTPSMSLLLSVAVFGVGFVTRPLGGLLIGAYADRAGRKPAMLLTIGLITVGTLGRAVTPSYESLGIAAPVIVVDVKIKFWSLVVLMIKVAFAAIPATLITAAIWAFVVGFFSGLFHP